MLESMDEKLRFVVGNLGFVGEVEEYRVKAVFEGEGLVMRSRVMVGEEFDEELEMK